jgi:anti-sigma factor RsiW
MRLTSEDLRELYQRETARSARSSVSDCLPQDMLTRAAAAELNQSERERIADHLATCSDCAKEYQAISAVKSWADEVSLKAAPAKGHHRPITLVPKLPASRRFHWPYALAAASLLLSLTFGALLISKWRENQRLTAEIKHSAGNSETAEALAESRRLLEETTRRVEQESAARRVAEEELAKRDAAQKSSSRTKPSGRLAPEVNVPIIDLNPQDAGRGAQNSQAATIQLPADSDLFTLILNLSGEDSSRTYALEVTDGSNRTIWRVRDLRKSPYNNFTVVARRRSFPAGEYRLKLYGLRDGRRELVEEYAIRLIYR